MAFELHQVEWTDEKVARFWDAVSKTPHLQYFAEQVGKRLIALSRKFVDLGDKILDYGSGKGFMIGYLLEEGAAHVSGCDFSDDSVRYVNKQFGGKPGFEGCETLVSLPSSLATGSYKTIFFMETIEHLLDKHLRPTLSEISRLTKKGGHVIVTTRNEENLDDLKVICPDCGCHYHRVQHVQSFSKASITALMKEFGFEKVLCIDTNLSR